MIIGFFSMPINSSTRLGSEKESCLGIGLGAGAILAGFSAAASPSAGIASVPSPIAASGALSGVVSRSASGVASPCSAAASFPNCFCMAIISSSLSMMRRCMDSSCSSISTIRVFSSSVSCLFASRASAASNKS